MTITKNTLENEDTFLNAITLEDENYNIKMSYMDYAQEIKTLKLNMSKLIVTCKPKKLMPNLIIGAPWRIHVDLSSIPLLSIDPDNIQKIHDMLDQAVKSASNVQYYLDEFFVKYADNKTES